MHLVPEVTPALANPKTLVTYGTYWTERRPSLQEGALNCVPRTEETPAAGSQVQGCVPSASAGGQRNSSTLKNSMWRDEGDPWEEERERGKVIGGEYEQSIIRIRKIQRRPLVCKLKKKIGRTTSAATKGSLFFSEKVEYSTRLDSEEQISAARSSHQNTLMMCSKSPL